MDSAVACETQALPKMEYDVGDTISFDSENVRPGSAGGTFVKKEKQTVIGLVVNSNRQTGEHGVGYITRDLNSAVPVERLVMFYPSEYSASNTPLYFSPVDCRYNVGFAEEESIHVTNPEFYLQMKSA